MRNAEFGTNTPQPLSFQAVSLESMPPLMGAGVDPRVKPEEDRAWGELCGKSATYGMPTRHRRHYRESIACNRRCKAGCSADMRT